MKLAPVVCCLSLFCFIPGCGETSTASVDPTAGNPGTTDNNSSEPAEKSAANTSDSTTMGRTIDLSPQNTSIEFVGVHTDPEKPDPRSGSFQEFSGTALVDQTLMSVQVDIQTESITTEIEKLTDHLKGHDFFDVKRFPTARFESTKVVDQENGTVEITGDLTLLDKTISITFPASVSADGEFTLEANFELDRTKWGMDFGTDSVEKLVVMTIKIGK